jgi:hypothetical protein
VCVSSPLRHGTVPVQPFQGARSAALFRRLNESAGPLANDRPSTDLTTQPRQPGGNWKLQLNVTRHVLLLTRVI